MLTISELIAVLSVCLASFSLGYKLGKDKSWKDTKNEQEQPPRSRQLEQLFLLAKEGRTAAGGTFFSCTNGNMDIL